jgi:acetoacetyl-CoA synthetase
MIWRYLASRTSADAAKMNTTHGLTDELVKRIKTAIRVGRSARHVPAKVCSPSLPLSPMLDVLTPQILQVSDIPVTLTGKRVEVPIRKVSWCR